MVKQDPSVHMGKQSQTPPPPNPRTPEKPEIGRDTCGSGSDHVASWSEEVFKVGGGREAWQELVGQAGAEEKDRCRAKVGSLQFDRGSHKDMEQRGKSGVVEGGAGG